MPCYDIKVDLPLIPSPLKFFINQEVISGTILLASINKTGRSILRGFHTKDL